MTDDFHFDTEIIIKLHHQGFRIREVPIPTFYGDEICYVNGLRYAKDILRAVYRYRQTRASVRSYPEYQEYFVKYRIKTSPWSGPLAGSPGGWDEATGARDHVRRDGVWRGA